MIQRAIKYSFVLSQVLILLYVNSCSRKSEDHFTKVKKSDDDLTTLDLKAAYLHSIEGVRDKYRVNMADLIENRVDKIEVFILSKEIVRNVTLDESSDYGFPIAPYEYDLKYTHKITLENDKKSTAAKLIAQMLRSAEKGSVFKHSANYGVACYFEDDLIFVTSISKQTKNFYITFPAYHQVVHQWYSIGNGSELYAYLSEL